MPSKSCLGSTFIAVSFVLFSNVLIVKLLYAVLFDLLKITEWPSVWERVANSVYHHYSVISLYVKICLSIFPFDV